MGSALPPRPYTPLRKQGLLYLYTLLRCYSQYVAFTKQVKIIILPPLPVLEG
jgi:hypothetical protein